MQSIPSFHKILGYHISFVGPIQVIVWISQTNRKETVIDFLATSSVGEGNHNYSSHHHNVTA